MSKNKQEKRKWVVTSAWPYVNAVPHLGTMIGSILSADIFARYLRLIGDEVVYVSGSDMHGTPVAVAAKREGISSEELAMKNHRKVKDLFKKWRISYDNYTHTHNDTHMSFVQDFYREVQKNGFVSEKEIESLYCEEDQLYLPDRFVEGVCPNCGYEDARGDQCDKCQKILTPLELKKPRCAICGNTPIIKETKHWYLDLPKLEDKIKTFIEKNTLLPQNARNASLNSINEGLPERSITRDLEWGIPAPFEGAEEKTIYVWFEAVLGYVSAVKEWAEKIKGNPEKFDYFWKDKDTKTVYFIGKDNIIFHLIVLPGLILGYNGDKPKEDTLVLPFNVSSTEFLMYENEKFSKSRGVGIWINEALELAHIDYWRFNLAYNRPEKSDTSFLWSEFDNNVKTLNDVVGNFIHRTFTFIDKQFDGKVPKRIKNDEIDEEFITKINNISNLISDFLEQFEIKKAIREIIDFAREGNIYLNDKAPWHLIKDNKDAAGHVFNLCIQCTYALAVLLAPYIPNTSEKILHYLNVEKNIDEIEWWSVHSEAIPEGKQIKRAKPLFEKLDIEELKEKHEELHQKEGGGKEDLISYEEFKKLDIRIAQVEKVEEVPQANKLYKLTISLGDETRTLAAGLAEHYKPEELEGKRIVVLANLEPKKLRGVMSEGMLLAAVEGKEVSILTPDKEIKPGSKIE
jgi:methionyl-tRNA synthetase